MTAFFSDLDRTLIFSHRVELPGEKLPVELLEGRVQSRVYTKVVDGCAQERTAFEVSVMHLLEDSEV